MSEGPGNVLCRPAKFTGLLKSTQHISYGYSCDWGEAVEFLLMNIKGAVNVILDFLNNSMTNCIFM